MRRFLLVASLLWGAVCSYAQPCGISYNYDVAGNRIKKYECWGVSSLAAGETALIQSEPIASDLPSLEIQHRNADLSGMIVFPNPAIEYFEIRAGADLPADAQVSILNAQGKLLLNRLMNDGRFELADYPAGTYFVVVTQAGRRFTAKLIKSAH